jgi:CheY-like chemotaxis protein
MKILIASKVGFIRHTLQRSLKQIGCRVTTTDSPQNTLEMVRNDGQIDVVVADWAMSGVSPTDIIKAIRRVERMNDEGQSAAPYVFVLINAAEVPEDDDHDGEQGLILAFGEVLIKPVNVEFLRERVRAIAATNEPKVKTAAPAVPSGVAEEQPAPAEKSVSESVARPHLAGLSGLELPVGSGSVSFD